MKTIQIYFSFGRWKYNLEFAIFKLIANIDK